MYWTDIFVPVLYYVLAAASPVHPASDAVVQRSRSDQKSGRPALQLPDSGQQFGRPALQLPDSG